jgi:hypothetical protein
MYGGFSLSKLLSEFQKGELEFEPGLLYIIFVPVEIERNVDPTHIGKPCRCDLHPIRIADLGIPVYKYW